MNHADPYATRTGEKQIHVSSRLGGGMFNVPPFLQAGPARLRQAPLHSGACRACRVVAAPFAFGLPGASCCFLAPSVPPDASWCLLGAAWGQVTQTLETKALKPILVLSGRDAAAQDLRRMTDRHSDVSAGCTYAKLPEARGHRGHRGITSFLTRLTLNVSRKWLQSSVAPF